MRTYKTMPLDEILFQGPLAVSGPGVSEEASHRVNLWPVKVNELTGLSPYMCYHKANTWHLSASSKVIDLPLPALKWPLFVFIWIFFFIFMNEGSRCNVRRCAQGGLIEWTAQSGGTSRIIRSESWLGKLGCGNLGCGKYMYLRACVCVFCWCRTSKLPSGSSHPDILISPVISTATIYVNVFWFNIAIALPHCLY